MSLAAPSSVYETRYSIGYINPLDNSIIYSRRNVPKQTIVDAAITISQEFSGLIITIEPKSLVNYRLTFHHPNVLTQRYEIGTTEVDPTLKILENQISSATNRELDWCERINAGSTVRVYQFV